MQQQLNLPDVEAAEDCKEETRNNWHGNGQKHCNYSVNPNPGHLKQGIAPDPHSVPAAHRHRLSNHILKRHLETKRQNSHVCLVLVTLID